MSRTYPGSGNRAGRHRQRPSRSALRPREPSNIYRPMRTKLTSDRTLSRGMLAVGIMLVENVKPTTGVARITVRQLAVLTGLSTGGVHQAVAALIERGHFNVLKPIDPSAPFEYEPLLKNEVPRVHSWGEHADESHAFTLGPERVHSRVNTYASVQRTTFVSGRAPRANDVSPGDGSDTAGSFATAPGGGALARPPQPRPPKPRNDRERATAEIAQLVGWGPLVELSESDLNALSDGWANGSITAETLPDHCNLHPRRS